MNTFKFSRTPLDSINIQFNRQKSSNTFRNLKGSLDMRCSAKKLLLVTVLLFATYVLVNKNKQSSETLRFLSWMDSEADEYIRIFDENCSEETLSCVNLSLVQAPICVHENDLVSKSLKLTGTYEDALVRNFIHLLKNDSAVGFVDIGANLGIYTIVAATFGRHVIAVDPWFKSLCRVRRSLILGNLYENVTLLLNGISHERGIAKISEQSDNIGAQRIHAVDSAEADGSHDYMKTILLKDILKVAKFKSAIFKIDIEGHEWLLLEHIRDIIDNFNVTVFMIETHVVLPLLKEECLRLYDMMAFKRYVPHDDPRYATKNDELPCVSSKNVFWVKQ